MNLETNNKECHRLGHELIFGVCTEGKHKGVQVKICKRCGTIWRRAWQKDIPMTNKNHKGNIDFTNFDEIKNEKQVITNEARESY